MTKFSAILATGRISNLPTVWCNVLIAFLLTGHTPHLHATLACVLIAASSLYVGGCFLGDAIDAHFDRAHKPDRPIPSGILSRKSIFTAAAFLLTLGTVLPLAYISNTSHFTLHTSHFSPLLLLTSIVTYSLWHKRSPWIGLPLIGACRFFLILFAASMAGIHNSTSSAIDFLPLYESEEVCYFIATERGLPIGSTFYALAVALYTISFASVARSESSPRPITWRKSLTSLMLLLPAVSFPFALSTPHSTLHTPHLLSLTVYLLWLLFSFKKLTNNKGTFVSMSLAGFCLLDATFAAPFGWLPLLTTLGLFLLSLLLQKIAPAT